MSAPIDVEQLLADRDRLWHHEIAALEREREQLVKIAAAWKDRHDALAEELDRGWQRTLDLRHELRQARAVVEAVRALADEWERECDEDARTVEAAELLALLPEPETSEATP